MDSTDFFNDVTEYSSATIADISSLSNNNADSGYRSGKISFIVIGAGLIGPRHAAHIVARPDCELFAIVDHSAKGPKVAEQFDSLLFKNLSEMFSYCEYNNVPYPTAAIIATPNHTHVKLGIELASKGIHLLVEKPLASNTQDCMTLISYCNHKNVKLLVGHHRRFNPYIIATKNNLDKLGRLVAMQGTWTLCKPPSYFLDKPWRSSVELGGGTLLINLIHDLDLLQYLLGPIEKVYAELLTKQRTDRFDEQSFASNELVDEGAVLTLKFANGCCGTFICSDNVTSPFSFEAGTGENPTVPFNDEVSGFYRIFGSHGTISVPDLKLYHQYELLPSPSPSPNYKDDSPIHRFREKPKPFDLQLDHFVNLIRGDETEVKCTGEDAVRALLCIEAVTKSIETGMPQYVESIDNIKVDVDMLNDFMET
ncbi:putative oxidoreductase [Scheffersomyces xylosifermentans]|uniref:putative oxidoreductase n=1 Tax=Scheffersomyces xylosifermentans TaxID=1304137 RepID=UPI00315DEA9A